MEGRGKIGIAKREREESMMRRRDAQEMKPLQRRRKVKRLAFTIPLQVHDLYKQKSSCESESWALHPSASLLK